MLHQKLKFMVEDNLVIICGEEDMLISELSLFRYIEIDEGEREIHLYVIRLKLITLRST